MQGADAGYWFSSDGGRTLLVAGADRTLYYLEARTGKQLRRLALKGPASGAKKAEILGKFLKNNVKTDPAVAAQLLRTWMDETDS